uniref:UEV domain-containing protein n=1 Tax=Plectus sambesii TaxID=2011161 RepID=A0A914UGN8_9BILA
MSDSAVSSALQAAGAKYFDAAKRDIVATLQSFRDLHPGTEMFEFPDRVRRQAFRLQGTLPVLYKGNTYNIPVALYLWDTHPYFAPICYVRPTPDMMVKASPSVDQTGKVYLPYLSEWRHPGYDLSGLLQVMTITFQESCPVFARTSGTTPGHGTAATTPYPNAGGAGAGAGAYTPYPSAGSHMPMPYGGGGGGAYTAPRGPYPPTPTGQAQNTPYPSYPAAYSNQQASQPPQPPARPYSQYGSSSQPTPYPTYQTQASLSSGTIQPEHIRASLLSAIEDRLRQRLREKLGNFCNQYFSISNKKLS